MSAYDNPTIIKDDSALIWGQMAGGIAQSFMQSFNAARQQREAREKDAKDQILSNQVFLSKSQYDNQAKMVKTDEELKKVGVDASGIDMYNKFKISTGEIIGDNDLSMARVVQSKEELTAKKAYSSQVAAADTNLQNAMGGLYSDSEAIKSGKINQTNMGSIRFNGDNVLSQAINRSTVMGNTFLDPTKTTRDLIYNVKGDPSDMTLLITNKIGTKDDVLKFLKETNPGIRNDKGAVDEAYFEQEFERGLKEKTGYGIIETKDKPGQYEFRFERKIDKDWDGSLYSNVPQIEYGKSPVDAGIYSKDGDNKIGNQFIKGLEFADIAKNAGLNKNQGTVKYERQEVDMDKIILSMKPTLVAQANGLVASYLSDNNVADGVLAQLGFGTNYPSKVFATLSAEEKVNKLVAVMEEKEKQNIITKSDLKLIKDDKGEEKYYIMDEANNKIFSEATTKSKSNNNGGGGGSGDGGQTKADVKAQANLNKAIKGVYDMTAKGTGSFNGLQGRKVIHRNGRFIIDDGGLKGNIIDDKNKVVEYLRDGTY